MSILSRSRGQGESEDGGKLPVGEAADGRAPEDGAAGNGPPEMSSEQLLVAVEVDERGVPRPLDNPTSFRVVRPLGEGGMGVVYLAMQTYPQRLVALKVLKTSVRQETMRRRFAREISALAKLQHRGIAQLLSAGNVQTTLGVQPFLTMQYIEGIPLTDYAVREKLGTDDKLRLFLKVCDAVTHAHRRGIVHRDLSPKNILVTDDGEPHVLDFGLAAMREDAARSGVTTVDGQVLGTLNYMSPEQARGSGKGGSREQDERTDVYALGVILFEMLTGSRPILRGQSTLIEALERLQNEAPLRASSIDRQFRGDIDTIAQKAIERDLAHRYATVAELAADIVRYLKHEPILAKPPSALYLTRKFVQRHKVMVSATAAVVLSLAIGLVAAVREANRANRQQRETALKLADAQVSQADTLLLMDRKDEARDLYNTAWDSYEQLGVPTLAAKMGVWDVDRRMWHKIATRKMFEVKAGEESDYPPTLSPDGLLIAGADGRGHVVVRDVVDWHVVMAADCGTDAEHASISNDSRLCAVMGQDNHVIVWDIRSGKVVREVAAEGEKSASWGVAMSGVDGYLAVTKGLGNGDVYWGSIRGDGPLAKIEDSRGLSSMAFDGTGELVLASYRGRLARFSPAARTLRQIRPNSVEAGTRAAVAPDGGTALVADKSHVTLIDTRTGNVICNFTIEDSDKAILLGSSHFLTAKQMVPRVYDLDGRNFSGPPGSVQDWSVSGSLAARATERGEIEIWSIADHVGITAMQAEPIGNCSCVLSADGRIVAIAAGNVLSVLDAETGLMLRRYELSSDALDVRFSPDALRVCVALGDGAVDSWDVRDNSPRHTAPVMESPVEGAFDDAGKFIVWTSGSSEHPGAVVVNLVDGTKRTLAGVNESVNGGAISADGTRLAVCTLSSELVVYDLAKEGKVLWHTPVGSGDASVAPVFSMNDRYVIAGRNEKELCVFDANTGALVSAFVRSGSRLARLHAAGETYVLAYDSRNLTIYDLRDFRRVRLLETGDDVGDAFAATRDVTQVVLVNGRGRAVVYDLGRAEETRAMERSEQTAGKGAAPTTTTMTEAFALYQLDPQFTAAIRRKVDATGSRAQAIALRRLGMPAGNSPGKAASDVLPGTKILLAETRRVITSAKNSN